MKEVKTIHDHYARQATPEVWTEVDELRKQRLTYERRILALELALKDAMRVAEEARTLAAIMRRNCENIDHAICVASNNRYHRDDGGGFKIEGFMPSVIAVEKAIAELTGIDGDDDWYWRMLHEPAESGPA